MTHMNTYCVQALRHVLGTGDETGPWPCAPTVKQQRQRRAEKENAAALHHRVEEPAKGTRGNRDASCKK